MKYFAVLFAMAGMLLAEESRREIVNAAPTPADDAKANSDKVPDVYPIYGKIGRVVIFRFKNDADLLAGMEKMIKQEKIRNAVILSGIGSLKGYQVHQISNRDFPSKNMFVKDPTAPCDMIGMGWHLRSESQLADLGWGANGGLSIMMTEGTFRVWAFADAAGKYPKSEVVAKVKDGPRAPRAVPRTSHGWWSRPQLRSRSAAAVP